MNGRTLKKLMAGAVAVLFSGGVASAWTGVGIGVPLQALMAYQAHQLLSGGTATAGNTPLLRNPGSYIAVRMVAGAGGTSGEQVGASVYKGRLISVPSNARAGDPAFAMQQEDAGEYVEVGEDEYERTYGMVFADGVNLGYTTLHRHDRPVRRPVHRGRNDAPEFGSNDLHRRAVLEFGEASQPRLDGLDDGFRRAQLSFHRATLTPGVRRESDGLRHERTGSRPAPARRTRW